MPTEQAPTMNRRRVLASAAIALPWLAANDSQAQEAPLKLCQSTALTGPLGDLGTALHQGAVAAFSAINAKGGIHGRQIQLQTLDDGYEVPRALANLDQLLADKDCFALFNCMGTPMVEAMLPKVKESGIPFFAPFTGGQLSRIPGVRNVFNIRASYAEEAEKCIQHLATLGIQHIAIAHQNNVFGKEVLAGARAAMERAKLPDGRIATVENNASDAAAAAQKIAEANPEAVLLGLAGKPALEFVKAFRTLRPGVTLYALSVLGTAANVKALGSHATGLVVSQVMPLPSNAIIPVVRDFQAAWKATDTQMEPSHLALEGYINARVFAEALQRAGKNPTRAAFIDATWSLRKMDLGGFEINASTPERNASRFVELTLVNRQGRFVR
ncbi:MAG: ABC transporter substrate-binding protein [Burkholderiales bacterium]|nr:ABC transporter substrate-binding protein [Burkholderiales bacterium]